MEHVDVCRGNWIFPGPIIRTVIQGYGWEEEMGWDGLPGSGLGNLIEENIGLRIASLCWLMTRVCLPLIS